MAILAKGAEAEIKLKKDSVLKTRVKKSYRIPEIDHSIRKSRTKREAKVIEKLQSSGISVAKLQAVDLENTTLELEYLKGKKVRDVLTTKNSLAMCKEIGGLVSKIHSLGVIHGDLTTSNMIHHKKTIFLIDFGLSFFSEKTEDKAVDIHVFKEALESKHPTFWEKGYKAFLKGYSIKDKKAILKRVDQVEERGRNKKK